MAQSTASLLPEKLPVNLQVLCCDILANPTEQSS